MRRAFVLMMVVSIVSASSPTSVHAAGLYRMFKEMFSSAGSKSASETGQAAVRQTDEAVSPPRSHDDDGGLEAGRFILEKSAEDALKNGYNRAYDDEHYQRDP